MLSRNGGIFLVMISLSLFLVVLSNADTVLIRSKHSKLTDSFVNLETKLHAFDGEPDIPWSGVSGINVPLPLNEIEKKKPDLETLMDHGVMQEVFEDEAPNYASEVLNHLKLRDHTNYIIREK